MPIATMKRGIPRQRPITKVMLMLLVELLSTPLVTTEEDVIEKPPTLDPDSPEDSAEVAATVADALPPTDPNPLTTAEPATKEENVIASISSDDLPNSFSKSRTRISTEIKRVGTSVSRVIVNPTLILTWHFHPILLYPVMQEVQ